MRISDWSSDVCSSDLSSSVYSYGQAQREQVVRTGTVEAVRNVTIQKDRSSGAGVLAGGALGGVAGSAIGGGTGNVLATIGGGILGAVAGNAVENQVGKTKGLEINVRLDTGETRVIAQEADVAISDGPRVGSAARVVGKACVGPGIVGWVQQYN